MPVQSRADNTNEPLILSENSLYRLGDIAQDAQRTTDLLYGTVMAQIAATELWTPWVNVAGVDGSAVPRGIYLGDTIPAADLVAGGIESVPILVGNATVNEELVVFDDDTLAADSVIGAGTIWAVTGRQALALQNIYFEDCVDISEFEN
jgi:hypothetical protein